MKEKIIGTFALIMGVMMFIDTVHPLSVGIYHMRPYLMPITVIGFGWLELHGRGSFKKHFNLPHIFSIAALALILLTLWVVTLK